MFRKYKSAYKQGQIDAVTDQAYLMSVVLLGLVTEVKNVSQKDKIFLLNLTLKTLVGSNNQFKILDLQISDLEELLESFNNQMLLEACSLYKDVYTPGGVSYKVLTEELKFNLETIMYMKQQIISSIQNSLDLLTKSSNNLIKKEVFKNYLSTVLSLL